MRSTTNGSPAGLDSLVAILCVILVLVAPPVQAADYEVRGNAMGFYYNTVLVHDGEGAAVTDATVTVNGTTLPHSTFQDGLYNDHLPVGVPDGTVLDLFVQVGPDIVTASGTLPDESFLTAPADGATFQDVSVIPVSWTCATSPDHFILYAQWGPGRTYEIPGDARTFDLPVEYLPLDTPIELVIYGYNDGTFAGSFLEGSEMNIRGRCFTRPAITINTPTPVETISWGRVKAVYGAE